MATEENLAQIGSVVLAQRSSSPSTRSRPSREARLSSNSREVHRYSDQLWQSKQQSSPSLLLYRKLSYDSGEGTVLDGEYECFDYSPKILSAKEKLHPVRSAGKGIEGITNMVTAIPGKSSEASPCQLDIPGEGVDPGRNRTGSTDCSCTTSPYTYPNMNSCHSPRSNPSPRSSPVNSLHFSSSPTQPNHRHIRRSSMPVSMLTFYKVIKEGGTSTAYLLILHI